MEESHIKRGLNIYLYYWVIPVFFAFVILNYYSRNFRIEAVDVGLMISIVSFLFGFLITISFSMILSRTSALKDPLAGETERLVSLYLLSKNLGSKFHSKITERIDEYTINTLREYTSYEVGRGNVYGMYEDLDLMEVKSEHQSAIANSFLYILGEFEPIREKLEYLTQRRLEWALRFTNYILGFLLITLLFLNRGDTFTNTVFIILSSTIIFILFILEDFDNLRIGDYSYNISNSEQIFDLIGKARYYPKNLLSRVELEEGKGYRIGFYNKATQEEKVFNISYNGTKRIKLGSLVKKLKLIRRPAAEGI